MHDALNQNQKEAVLHGEGPLLILAGAGAGKTRVVVHRIAELIRKGTPPEKILAVTFTNKAASEMKERVRKLISEKLELSPYDLPAPQTSRRASTPKTYPFIGTFHALSLHILKTFHQKAGLPKRFSIFDRSDSLKAAKKAIENAGFDPKELEPRRVLSVMSRAKGDALSAEEFRNQRAASYIDEAIAEVWEGYQTILKKEKALDFDDILLTAYRLLCEEKEVREHFRAAWDFIHVDEYQDTNRVQYELIRTLARNHNNLCVVGDGDQCLLKGTQITMANGREKPIEKIKKGDMVLSNYGAGDIRPALITRKRARTHRKNLIRIKTASGKVLTSTPDHMHFADYRLGIAPQYHFTYVMYKKGVGWRLGTTQIYTRGQKNSKVGFKQRCLQEHADAVWIVGVFKTPQEARVHEYVLSLHYKIPTLPFVARKGSSAYGYVHDQTALNTVFKFFDTETAAKKLIKSKHLSLAHPHHRPQSVTDTRRTITLTLCGETRNARAMHRIAMVGQDVIGRKTLEKLGLSVRPAKQGSRSWRMETCNSNYGGVLALAKKIQRALPETVILQNARLGSEKKLLREYGSLRFTPAASVLPGMALFSHNGKYEVVETVEVVEAEEDTVYDIDVEGTHNFIANGIVTHNCIYSWRGASLEHILNFEHDFPGAKIILLTENYRSTKTIIQAANDAIAKNIRRKEKELFTNNTDGDPIAIVGTHNETGEAAFVVDECRELIKSGVKPEDIAVLYRANFQSRVLEEAFLGSGIEYQVLGTRFFERKEIKDMLSYLRLAENRESATDLTRAIGVPSRGIGKVTLLKLLNGEPLPGAAQKKVHAFFAVIDRIAHKIKTAPTSEAVRFAINESGTWNLYAKGKGEDEERLENLKELVTVATKYDVLSPEEGIAKLLEEAALQSDQDELPVKREDKPGVKLMTVHASKGLEFPYVFITGLEEGLFPHERDNSETQDEEEERRLFYVALTRAEKKVYASYAMSRRIFGTRSTNLPSEFISEMDPSLAEIVASPEPRAYDKDNEIIF